MNGAAPWVLVPPVLPLAAPPAGRPVGALAGTALGTAWRLRWVPPLGHGCDDDIARLRAVVDAVLARIDAQMSHWREDSLLSAFGRLPPGEAMALPPDFATTLRIACQVAALSDGAFDPTLDEAVRAWGFGPAAGTSPDAPVPHVAGPPRTGGWRALRCEGGRVSQPGGVRLDLSAVAKGHAVDAVADALAAAGIGHFLFELGGELRARGLKPGAQPWWVGVERPPEAACLPELRIALVDGAVASSGDWRQRRRLGDRWLSHTLDPRTGAPVDHALSAVTVCHAQAAWADALATALCVLGPQAGTDWAEAHEVAAWFVARTPDGGWREWPSTALARWLAD
ncbi:FAD:protein FMN transferase [Ideonella sp.]|uniref:FAD:protein FMN transferase n=1 Tax=Ideonella sp. TaxID=1929293 RepID=UPI0035ADFBD4